MSTVFTANERRAFAPPERLKPSEWPDRHRYLTPNLAAEPGPYRIARTPFIPGIIDAMVEPGVEEIVLAKAAQVAYSTTLGNMLGWCVDQDPAPGMFVLPTEDDAKKFVNEQLRPLIESSEALRSHLVSITKDTVLFDTMPLYLAYAGSPGTLAGRALRWLWLDELDKMVATSGREGNPIALARKRGSTFGHRRRMVMGCTPTTPDGHITREYESCGDRRNYLVPCPTCGAYQKLVFGQLRFDMPDVKAIEDRAKRADYVQANGRAEYECIACRHRIQNAAKQSMLLAGRWASDGQRVDADGTVRGERPRSSRVGFHLSGLYSPWESFPVIAARFLRAVGHRADMREFHNQTLGEAFQEVVQKVTVDDLRSGLAERPQPPAGIVPAWAGKLIATADVQGDRLYYVVRAWGRDRSQLVEFGEVYTFDDLRDRCLSAFWAIDGAEGDAFRVHRMCVDSGYRTNEVYRFAGSDGRVVAVKGAPSFFPAQPVAWSTPIRELGVNLAVIDTQFFKSAVSDARRDGRWLLNDAVTDEYLRHLASEVQRPDPRSGRPVWLPVTEGAANHFLDCEGYQFAAAQFEQVNLLPDEATLVAQRQLERDERRRAAERAARSVAAPVAYPDGAGGPRWIAGGRGDWLGR